MAYENKEPLSFYTALYTGKELLKKGERKDKDTNEMVAWKMYRLFLKANKDDQYPVKFSVFAGCKGWELLDELEGEPIKVGFTKGSFTNEYGTFESRTVKFIDYGKLEDVAPYKKPELKTKTTSENPQVELTEAQRLGIINDLKSGDITPQDIITIGVNKVVVKDVFPDYQKYMSE